MSEFTLKFPKSLSSEVGLSANEINALKRLGCPFWGRKTCVAWVRAFLERETGAALLLARAGHPPRRALSRFGERVWRSGSPDASPRPSKVRCGDSE